MKLSTIDDLIHATLMVKVRVMSLQQIASAFHGGDVSNANRRLRRLVSAGILAKHNLIARRAPVPTGPIQIWDPGCPTPNFESLSRSVKRRWQRTATRPTTVFVAARRFASSVGKRTLGRLSHPLQVSHDLGLSSVYLHLWDVQPVAALRWVGEDSFPQSSRKKQSPDAFLMGINMVPERAIEYAGFYDAKRFKKFHSYCFNRGLSFDIY